ncbi:hypothetical protein TNCV_808181 [Trichonephila clavipes]|nr:hypothetical protein TNCV_808181 [Trichonephila clavipes]
MISDWSLVLFTDESGFTLECDTRRVGMVRKGNSNNSIFFQEKSRNRRGGLIVWSRNSIGQSADLHIIWNSNLTVQRQSRGELFEAETILRMDWPTYCPGLNPFEHVWDTLGRRVAARTRSSDTVQHL